MSDWRSTTLQEILSTIESGSRPKGGVRIGENSEGVPSYGGENISMNGGMLYDTVRMVPANFAAEMKRGILSDRDVLINKDGANTGKSAIYRRPAGEEFATINEHLFLMRCNKDAADQEFLYHFLNSELGKSQIARVITGSAQPGLNSAFPEFIRIDLPPLPKQKKIAEILSGIDRSIQAEVNMASKITKQYQGVLSQIFDCASKQIPLGDYLPLGDLDLDISDGNYSAKYPSASEFVERGVPFIRASNMKEGTIDDKDMRFISAIKHQEITKGHLKAGDILIANRGEIGKTSRVPDRHIGSNINAQVVRINGGKKIDSSFLFHYLSSPFCQTLIDELTTGTALKQLPIGNLVKLLIPAPEMSIQIATGGALDSMQRAMNAISEKIRKRSQLKQALATELLSGRKRVSV